VVERTRAGVEAAKERGNDSFSKGSVEEAVAWFSKGLWVLASGHVSDALGDASWRDSMQAILHSNRAFAYSKLRRWEDAERDSSSSLTLRPQNVKALYRRAVARTELGKVSAALQDVNAALQLHPDGPELLALKARLSSGGSTGSGASSHAGPEAAPAVSTTNGSAAGRGTATAEGMPETERLLPPSRAATQAPSRTARARGATAVRTLAEPSLPASSPKNAFEMLRHFNSMKRHPALLAKYVRERVPPPLVRSLFSRSPIEPDDLATLLSAIRSNAQDHEADFGPEVVAEYLRQILRSKNAETQLAMLSTSEKQVLCELLEGLPAGGEARRTLQTSLRAVLA